ncbi:MAG: SGNH/GDSL hydrolase family protein, partial [Motiliproteus sp.]|nr:SGNH/GDSL hydrolase family protein [Motiliproteus sp.]
MDIKSKNRSRLYATIIFLLTTVICLAIAEWFLRSYQSKLTQDDEITPGLLQYHSQFGWVLAKNWQGNHKHHDFEVNYNTDSQGYRISDSRDKNGSKNVEKTVAFIGDSFTFGLGVNDDQTFTALLNQKDPTTKYLNLGIPGYSTDQQYLLMKYRHSRIRANHYILVFYLGNDFLDNALGYPLQTEYAKPYFTIGTGGQLVQNNYPVPKQPKPDSEWNKSVASIAFGDELLPQQSSLQSIKEHSALLSRLAPKKNQLTVEQTYPLLAKRLQQQSGLAKAILSQIGQFADSRDFKISIALLPGKSYAESPTSVSGLFQSYVASEIKAISKSLNLEVLDLASKLAAAY